MAERTKFFQITQDDLERALAANEYGGGYAESNRLPRRLGLALDAAIVERAGRAGMDYDALYAWVTDKNARWLVDLVADCYAGLVRLNPGWNRADVAEMAVNAAAILGTGSQYLPGEMLHSEAVR